jgi:hypothetical protein
LRNAKFPPLQTLPKPDGGDFADGYGT